LHAAIGRKAQPPRFHLRQRPVLLSRNCFDRRIPIAGVHYIASLAQCSGLGVINDYSCGDEPTFTSMHTVMTVSEL
jgi:hypothetical protein